jgi:O-antigen/teichoic acid export membrane protein
MNDNSRLSNSIKNISFGLVAQLVQMLLGFVSRTVFIRYLAVEYLGVNGLFSNILSLLSLAELGITSAIVFSLYKPLAERNEQKLAGLINFFSKVYTRIALIVALIGLCLLPFLDKIVVNPTPKIADSLYIIYLLFLFNTVSAYFMQYKLSLFHADQKSYVISKNNTILFLFQNLAQILVLVVFKNFIAYLIVQSVFQVVSNFVLSNKVTKHYSFLNRYKNEKIEEAEKQKIYSNVKSTGLIKIGGLLVNSTDNLILNYFSGLLLVGLLSNYVLLLGLASGLIMQVFSGLTGSIAHINVTETKEKQAQTFYLVNFANFWIYGLATIGIIFLMNDFILIWIGSKFILPISVVFALAFNFYIFGMQNAVWTFKSTYGFFKQGQYLVILTALLNLVLSFALGYFYGLLGILTATAIARIVTNTWYDPYIVISKGLQQSPLLYFKKYIKYLFVILVSLAFLFGINYLLPLPGISGFVFKIVLIFIIPNIIICLMFKNNAEFKIFSELIKVTFIKLRG